jgi:glutamyl-tRNA reductase
MRTGRVARPAARSTFGWRSTLAGAPGFDRDRGEPSSVPLPRLPRATGFDGPDGRRVVLVGAGRTSELTARNLRSRGATVSAVVNRTVDRAERLAASLGARALSLEDVTEALGDADVVVSSTSAPGFVLTAEALAAPLRARRGRPVLFVDLAVPRDVDPSLAAVDGCFVYDVDDLEAVVSAPLEGRRAEAVHAERIVAAEADRFRAWQASLAVVPPSRAARAGGRDPLVRARARRVAPGPAPRRAQARGVDDVADRRQDPAPADGANEGGSCRRGRCGLC